jgi:hypothetical protein
MFMVPGLRARPPIREAILKNVYTSPGSGSLVGDKNTRSVGYYEKVTMQLILPIPSSAGFFFSFFITFADFQDNTYLVRVA